MSKKLRTTDSSHIKQVIKHGLVHEIRSNIIRNMAINWRDQQKQKNNE